MDNEEKLNELLKDFTGNKTIIGTEDSNDPITASKITRDILMVTKLPEVSNCLWVFCNHYFMFYGFQWWIDYLKKECSALQVHWIDDGGNTIITIRIPMEINIKFMPVKQMEKEYIIVGLDKNSNPAHLFKHVGLSIV